MIFIYIFFFSYIIPAGVTTSLHKTDATLHFQSMNLCLDQGSQTQFSWGPLEVESGSGWAVSSIPQKKVAQLTQSKLMIGL
jgi:hypothetical protein